VENAEPHTVKDKAVAIDSLGQPSHDEAARQALVARMRKVIMSDMAEEMRSVYEDVVEPCVLVHSLKQETATPSIRKFMERLHYYQFWSSMRYNAQEMVWGSVSDQVERDLGNMIGSAQEAFSNALSGGTLRLNPALKIPKSISSLDIHLMPGCFHSELTADDVAVGAVYARGTSVFSGGLRKKSNTGKGGVADSVGHYLRLQYPDFKPKRILDLGCTIGSNLLPFQSCFPDAELYGIDAGAPVLRYAHARADSMGVCVNFSQQNAEDLDFEDGKFDLVVSSFFFHEIAVSSTKKIIREIRRVLSPGGITVHMELPPANLVDDYYNFFLDWDAYHNHEPHYKAFRQQDPIDLLIKGGFEEKKCGLIRIPDRGGVSDDEFSAVVNGKGEAPKHSNFSSYYLFFASK
jgi:SAM-dependent methyltransferase